MSRAQSETIGVILLTAVIVILVGGFSVLYLGADNGGPDGPLIDADVSATSDRVSITHAGGESVPIGELAVLIRSDEASERYAFDANDVSDGEDGAFDSGDRYERGHGVGGGKLDVRLIHTASNNVLQHEYMDVEESESTATTTFGYQPHDPAPGETLTFDASASAVPGSDSTYAWDWNGDGEYDENASTAETGHTFSDEATTTSRSLSLTMQVGEIRRLVQSRSARNHRESPGPL